MKQKLRGHEENCFAFAAQRTAFPDIHCKIQKCPKSSRSILKQLSDGNKYEKHIACSYAYQIVSNIPGVEFDSRIYVGEDAVHHFLDTLQEDLNVHHATH